jgi:hypothetical protein
MKAVRIALVGELLGLLVADEPKSADSAQVDLMRQARQWWQ